MPNYANLSFDEKIAFLLQWLSECAEFERKAYQRTLTQLCQVDANFLATWIEAAAISSHPDRPPTLFDCRLKVLRDWYMIWSDRERREFLNRLQHVDPTLATAVRNAEPIAVQNGQSSLTVVGAESLRSNGDRRMREMSAEDAEVQGINRGPDHLENVPADGPDANLMDGPDVDGPDADEQGESPDLALTD